jgi:phytoene desaturase
VKRVVIIGAGMGGLATALRLRHLGYEVAIYEKLPRVGGRSNLIEQDGFRVDCGPTILVMKDVFEETYRAIGEDLNLRVPFIQLDPNYRIYYHDGTRLELFASMPKLAQEVEQIQPGSAEHLFRFIGESAKKYELGMDFVDRNFDHLTDLANPKALVRLLETSAQQNLYKQVDGFFHNDKLNKAFSFHTMFLGLSPFDSLAMYSLITYADLALGMWYPQGGIYHLIEDMLQLAEQRGVAIHTSSPVAEITVESGVATGIRLESGEHIPAEIIISNADLPYTYKKLVKPTWRKKYRDQRLDGMAYACSGYLLYLGLDRSYEDLRHQSLYFSQDYQANLKAIFNTKTLPEDPSFHLNIPTVSDPSLAPAGHTLLYVLAPMPNLSARIDWKQAAPHVREQLLQRLEQLIDPDLRQHIVWEQQYTPMDYERDLNATLGTAFGSLSHGFFQSAYFRPHNKARDIANLYFVGQGTYPGIGMPMVQLSAKLVCERIVKEWS